MELLLLAVAAVSLALALVMSLTVVRMSRAERARAAARVAALSAAAAEPPREAVPPAAGVSAPVAPIVLRPSAVASDTPRAADAGLARTPDGKLRPAAPWASVRVQSALREASAEPIASSVPPAEELLLQTPTTTLGDRFLGTAEASGSGGRQRGLAFAAVLLFAVIAGGGYWTISGSRADASPSAASPAGQSPLELVSLRHERKGAKLDVTGLIRNPVSGLAVERLTAVVFLFDQQGGFLSSARAGVDYRTLSPGEESPFVISLDAPANVARYRVSFRTEAGIVPHIDRRAHEPVAAHVVNDRAVAR
jgi:hypothetical protein